MKYKYTMLFLYTSIKQLLESNIIQTQTFCLCLYDVAF